MRRAGVKGLWLVPDAGDERVGDERENDEREQRGGRAHDHLEDELQQFEDRDESDEGTPVKEPR